MLIFKFFLKCGDICHIFVEYNGHDPESYLKACIIELNDTYEDEAKICCRYEDPETGICKSGAMNLSLNELTYSRSTLVKGVFKAMGAGPARKTRSMTTTIEFEFIG